MKILLAQINPTVGDLEGNTEKILRAIHLGRQKQAEIVLFPELALTGYPPEDLLLLPHFIDAVEQKLVEIAKGSIGIIAIVGLPRRNPGQSEKFLFNSAAIIRNGLLEGYYDKMLLPTYDVFDERRYFEPGLGAKIWNLNGKRVAVTICEDIWQHSELLSYTTYQRDPIADLIPHQPDLVLNLSASPYSYDHSSHRLQATIKAAASLYAPLLLCNQVGGNDSLIFDGYSLYVDGTGDLIERAKGFEEDFLVVDVDESRPSVCYPVDKTEDLYKALVIGTRDYFKKSGFKKACLGLSGGIDSAVVARIAVEALGAENVSVINMPSRYSSKGSYVDALALSKTLGIEYTKIPIEEVFKSYLHMLEPYFNGMPVDTTEENIQARIRGMILMALSNKLKTIVLSAGNKSELAMGYSTLYGDLCGGLAVISDVTKTQVYALAHWINRNGEIIPKSIIEKPPSAELKENQKDSDTLPDYAILDQVLRDYVEEHHAPEKIAEEHGYPLNLVQDLIQRIHRNEYKRRQSPPGLRVTQKSFTAGRRFPIVQKFVSQ